MMLTTGNFKGKRMMLIAELKNSDLGPASDGNELFDMRIMV
jgi:hypothetical protein